VRYLYCKNAQSAFISIFPALQLDWLSAKQADAEFSCVAVNLDQYREKRGMQGAG
jgi:hypothetical protein